jgi:hypothetical protein
MQAAPGREQVLPLWRPPPFRQSRLRMLWHTCSTGCMQLPEEVHSLQREWPHGQGESLPPPWRFRTAAPPETSPCQRYTRGGFTYGRAAGSLSRESADPPLGEGQGDSQGGYGCGRSGPCPPGGCPVGPGRYLRKVGGLRPLVLLLPNARH